MQKLFLQEKEEINRLPNKVLHCLKSGMLLLISLGILLQEVPITTYWDHPSYTCLPKYP
jgi:hypothetical protein